MKVLHVIGLALAASVFLPVLSYAACPGNVCFTVYDVPNASLLNVKGNKGGYQCPNNGSVIYSYGSDKKDTSSQTLTTGIVTQSPPCPEQMQWKIADSSYNTCLSATRGQVHAAKPISSNASSTTMIPLSYTAGFTINAELGNQESCTVISQTQGKLTFFGCEFISSGTQVSCCWATSQAQCGF